MAGKPLRDEAWRPKTGLPHLGQQRASGAGVVKRRGLTDDDSVFAAIFLLCFRSGTLTPPTGRAASSLPPYQETTKITAVKAFAENSKWELRARFDLEEKKKTFFSPQFHRSVYELRLQIPDLTLLSTGRKGISKLKPWGRRPFCLLRPGP